MISCRIWGEGGKGWRKDRVSCGDEEKKMRGCWKEDKNEAGKKGEWNKKGRENEKEKEREREGEDGGDANI